MDCGNMETPPSRGNVTIWGIVEIVVLAIVGLLCLFNFFDILRFGHLGVWEIVGLVGNGLGVAGLIFVALGLFQSNSAHIKIGITCFLVSIIISIVVLVFRILGGEKLYFGMVATVVLYIFLAYILWKQSSHL